MIPIFVIVGRPNVGKSTLFNVFTKTRDALVVDVAGVTRDRKYGVARYGDWEFSVIDTGGLEDFPDAVIGAHISKQVEQAIEEADGILCMVDARTGITVADSAIVDKCRRSHKPVFLVVNKVEGGDATLAAADFYSLGLGEVYPISAAHRQGIDHLLDALQNACPESQNTAFNHALDLDGIKIAIVGRPNVGKSTLVNRLLGEDRVIVFDRPGTTLDTQLLPMRHRDQEYVLIDTAGIRRSSRVEEALEKFSVIKTLQAVQAADVALILFDAKEGITDQDLHIVGYVIQAGKPIILVINKWDNLEEDQKQIVLRAMDRRLEFVSYAERYFISALHGTGVGHLFDAVQTAYQASHQEYSTGQLTTILEQAISDHPPPLVRGRRIKLRYAHLGGHSPLAIVIHGNQTHALPVSYKRYLANVYRTRLQLTGVPVAIVTRTSDNPYKNKINRLTPRQAHKRRRLIQHKKKK